MRCAALGLVVFVLAGTWVGLGRADDAALARGRAHVEKTCAVCHGGQLEAVVRARLEQGPDALDAFLATHHAADASLRADVLAYLQARFAAAASAP